MDLEEILEAIRSDDPHYPVSRLIVLENTHNRTGGSVLSQGYTEAVAKIASQNNLKVHLDGARIFNAAAALGIEAASLAKDVESVTFCLSKGLCAPVGSVLCGSEDFIRRARRARKLLGGGMRQAGVLAAAGIVALETMVDRLSEDHARARRLADGLRDIPEIAFFQDPPPTNMLIISIDPDSGITTEDLIPRLAQDGIKVVARDSHNMRLVTHYWITDEAVDLAVAAFARAMT